MNKKIFSAVTFLVLGLIILGGISVYSSPTREVSRYISEFPSQKSNRVLYPDNIADFFLYDEQKGLTAPSVKLKTLHRTLNTSEVIATFEVITYDSNNVPAKVYSGHLLFSLARDNLHWKISNVKIINDMKEVPL